MTEDMMDGIAKVLIGLGYKYVEANAGILTYEELDGTKHRLIEDTFENGKWIGA